MFRRLSLLSRSLGVLLTLFCLTGPGHAQVGGTPDTVLETTGLEYRLGAGDALRIAVFGEEDLGGEYVVDGSGFVSLPLIGQVRAGGYTVREFEGAVIGELSDGYLRTPRVSVEVTNYRPFYIMGEVNSPGQYPYIAGMSVLNAVALAGGYTYRANESRVFIRRNGSETEETAPADPTTRVGPGDIIRIGERFF